MGRNSRMVFYGYPWTVQSVEEDDDGKKKEERERCRLILRNVAVSCGSNICPVSVKRANHEKKKWCAGCGPLIKRSKTKQKISREMKTSLF